MAVITNPISNIPVNEKSHTLGWSKVWASHLYADIDYKCSANILKHDIVYIDFGANYSGSLNLFGGANQELFNRLNLIMQCKKVLCLDWPFEISESLRKRIGAKTTYEGFTDDWFDKLEAFEKNVQVLKQEDRVVTGITMGDSHTIAFSQESDAVLRNDGKTLYGALKLGINNMFRGMPIKGNITLCFGSIDIRHHFLRENGLNDNLSTVIETYIKQGSELEKEYGCNVSYAYPVPVEWEGRKIPKTGFYKGSPFHGSMQERRIITNKFISELNKHKVNVIAPPDDWYTMDPKAYAETYMEFGSSFHIAPPYYRREDFGVTTATLF
jgi:hypothetical protein